MSKKTKRSTNKPSAVSTARIARIAKGKRPQYFSDPAIDKLLAMSVTLMEELSVTRDRLDAVERLLARKRQLKLEDIEHFVPTATDASTRAERRQRYVARVLRALHAELEATVGADSPKSEAEILAALEK